MMGWLKYLIPVISMLLLAGPFHAIENINLRTRARWAQGRFVRWALIYAFTVTCLFRTLSGLIAKLLRWTALQPYLNAIAPSGMIGYAIALFEIILINAAILIVFTIVKRIVRIGADKVKAPDDWTDEGLSRETGIRKHYWAALNWVYHLDDRGYFLRVYWVKVKRTLKYFTRATCVIYILTLLILEIPFVYNAVWFPVNLAGRIIGAAYLWPAISMLVAAEFAWFLDGMEQEEWIGKPGTGNVGIFTEAGCGGLEAEYKRIYKGRYVRTLNPPARAGEAALQNAASSDPIIDGIKRKLTENKLEINPAYIRHIENIADGRDVIIDASVYSQFGEYLYRYLNVMLSRGQTVLFVSPDVRRMEQLRKYTEERLKLINSFHPIWKMKGFTEQNGAVLEDIDILFATPRIISDEKIFDGFGSFFAKLSAVIITDTAEVTAGDNIPLSLLGFRLTNIVKNRGNAPAGIQYICLTDGIPPGVRKAVAETLRLSGRLLACGASPATGHTVIMLWRYEDLNKNKVRAQDVIFASQAEAYWGVALPLASVALKRGAVIAGVFPGPETPWAQMLDSMNGSRRILNEYFGKTPVDLDAQISFNRYNKDNLYTRFGFIDDGNYNLPMTLYNSGRFGGVKMLHIISKPYMLRDFFFAKAEGYLSNEPSIHMLMPAVADTKLLSVCRLLHELRENGLLESEIQNWALQWSAAPAGKTGSERTALSLRDCLQTALCRENLDSVYNYFEFKRTARFNTELNGEEFEECYIVRLKNDDVMKGLLTLNKPAVLNIRGKEFYAGFFADGIFQRRLPGQYMSFDGYLYQITDIDPQEGVIYLSEGPDSNGAPSGYTQIRTYIVDNAEPREDAAARTRRFGSVYDAMVESYTITRYRMPVTVKTSGYFTHPTTGEPLNFMEKPQIDGESDYAMQSKALRAYEDASVLSLEFNGKLGPDTDRAAFLLAGVMNEFFKTWFPYSYSCVAVCPVLKDPDAIYSDEYGRYIAKVYPRMELTKKAAGGEGIELYIIEDSKTDLGIVQALSDNWQEMFTLMFENIGEYLNWQQSYEERDGVNITNRYLYFGKDGEPDCFDFKTLTRMFNELGTDRWPGDAVKSIDE